jgi:Zn-finger nucleic acid-binding protein
MSKKVTVWNPKIHSYRCVLCDGCFKSRGVYIDVPAGKYEKLSGMACKSCAKNYKSPPRKTMTIDITPTWSQIMPWLIRGLEDRRMTENAKDGFRAELMRLARLIDDMNASVKSKK